jgi:hypothetical protein
MHDPLYSCNPNLGLKTIYGCHSQPAIPPLTIKENNILAKKISFLLIPPMLEVVQSYCSYLDQSKGRGS